MSLWPTPGIVVQRLTSQQLPYQQHAFQHPRTPAASNAWNAQHPQQQQQQQFWGEDQLQCFEQPQQYNKWESLQYVLHQQSYAQQQQQPTSARTCRVGHGLTAVAVAAAAVARPQSENAQLGVAAAAAAAAWPSEALNNLPDMLQLHHGLVQWPVEKQPKQGYITKAKLRKLTAVELRAELSRLGVPDCQGLKEDLINALLLQLLQSHTAKAAAAPQGAATSSSNGTPAQQQQQQLGPPITFTARGMQLLQQVAPGVASAAQQQQGGAAAAAAASDGGLSLQALMRCQQQELRSALSAVWPRVSTAAAAAASLSNDQLLSGPPAELAAKLVLCLAATCAADLADEVQQQQQQPSAATQPQQQAEQQTTSDSRKASQQQQQAAVAEQPSRRTSISSSSSSRKDASESSTHIQPTSADQQQQQPQQQPQQQQSRQPLRAPGLRQLQDLQYQQQALRMQEGDGVAKQYAPATATPVSTYSLRHGPVVVPGTVPPYDPVEAARVADAVGVQLEELPPLAQQARGQIYDVDWMTSFTDAEKDMVLKANRAGLVLTVVGGAAEGSVSGDASPCCVGLLREKDAWLFDAGEDTQRQLMWLEHIRPSKLHRVVVSRQTPDALLGLPGVLCVIGASREKGHEKADIPVHVFGPEGTCEFLKTMYDCGNTFLEMPVVVHEFVHHAVAEDEMAPTIFSKRSKLWRVLLPPDQLNPQGFVDAHLDNFKPLEGRARVKKGSRSAGGVLATNPRAGYRPLPTPPPGDPTRTGLLRQEMTWTVRADEAALLTAVAVEAPDLTWAMVWKEADKQGNLSVPRCQALNINNAELYGLAKTGAAVPNEDGIIIPSYMVCTQDKPGRKVVLLPPCDSAEALAPMAADADVMLAHASAAASAAAAAADTDGVSAAPVGTAVGRLAREWGVRALVTTAMPQSQETLRAFNLENNQFVASWRQKRLKTVGAGGSGSASDADDVDDGQEEGGSSTSSSSSSSTTTAAAGAAGPSSPHLQPWEQAAAAAVQDAETAAFLQAVAAEYDCGLLVPGRDCLSLMVDENSGTAPPLPLNMQAKQEEARATCLMESLEPAYRPPKLRHQQQQQRGGGGGGGGGRGHGSQQSRQQQQPQRHWGQRWHEQPSQQSSYNRQPRYQQRSQQHSSSVAR